MDRFRKSRKVYLSAGDCGKIMLWQVKKILHCHFPELSARLSALSDPRIGPQYTIEELVMASIVLFLLKCDSRNDFNHKCKDDQFRSNYRRMFRLKLPQMDAVNDLFEKMETSQMEELRCCFINSLIEKRVFHRLRFFDKFFYFAIDGTGVYHWSDTPVESILHHALRKESKTGKVSYSNQIVEAALVCSNGMTIPLMTEWVANNGADCQTQDCELNAFKRLCGRLKKSFPRLKVCILVDGLYTNVSMMEICKQSDWGYVTVFKDGNLSSVWEEVNSLLPIKDASESCRQQVGDSTHWITRNYRWIKDLEYQKHKFNWMECVQERLHRETKEKSETRFVFLTNLDVNRLNIADILMAARARWQIEDHFNTQKNRGGSLHHKYNRNDFKAMKNWHSVRQLACMMTEFVKYTLELQQLKKDNAKMTWKELWKRLNSFLIMCIVDEAIDEFETWSLQPRQVRLE